MHLIALTPNEATIAGAVLGALLGGVFGGVVSFLTARYIVKHSANYEEQIADLHQTLGALARTQDEWRLQHATAIEAENQRRIEAERRAEAARWKPVVRIISKQEGIEQINVLRLESTQQFALSEVCLVSSGGAKLYDYPVAGAKAFSTGFSIPIDRKSLNLLTANSQQFFDSETFDGQFRYAVVRMQDGSTYEGVLPFHGQGIMVGIMGCYKLSG